MSATEPTWARPTRIDIELPFNRLGEGTLRLIGQDGDALLTARCRGKADGRKAAREGNRTRSPLLPYGDTPSGIYQPTRVHHFPQQAKSRLGPAWMPIIGVHGDALAARQNGRVGLGIHGGRGDAKLIATYGCVRMLDKDFGRLAELLGDAEVGVTIRDV